MEEASGRFLYHRISLKAFDFPPPHPPPVQVTLCVCANKVSHKDTFLLSCNLEMSDVHRQHLKMFLKTWTHFICYQQQLFPAYMQSGRDCKAGSALCYLTACCYKAWRKTVCLQYVGPIKGLGNYNIFVGLIYSRDGYLIPSHLRSLHMIISCIVAADDSLSFSVLCLERTRKEEKFYIHTIKWHIFLMMRPVVRTAA